MFHGGICAFITLSKSINLMQPLAYQSEFAGLFSS
jgi:hypothetical protein